MSDIDPRGLVDKPDEVPAELRRLARDLRRIGCGYRADPETILMRREEISDRLTDIARRLETAR